MARDRANINTGIWNDADFRHLSLEAQHLYFLLMTHPTLTYVGVADWRPARLTPFAADLTLERIERAAAELVSGYYIVIDEETEEVLVRSFVKHDGVLKHPKLKVSMAKAYTSTSSNLIRGIIVHELLKQREEHPEYPCWDDSRVADVLTQPAINPKGLPTNKAQLSLGVSHEPSLGVSQTPSPGLALPTSTATSTTTPSSSEEGGSGGKARKRATPLPDDWAPTDAHRALATERGVDCDLEASKMRDWAAAEGKTGKDWNARFRLWLNSARPERGSQQRPNRDAASSEALVQAHLDMQAMGGPQ